MSDIIIVAIIKYIMFTLMAPFMFKIIRLNIISLRNIIVWWQSNFIFQVRTKICLDTFKRHILVNLMMLITNMPTYLKISALKFMYFHFQNLKKLKEVVFPFFIVAWFPHTH